ncbi:E3 ubiquitin-protein ligase TRIM71-like [Saccoglossus kowalevskii]
MAMAASNKSLLDEVTEDFLSCSICLEIYKNPKVLPCLHTYCQQCLRQRQLSTDHPPVCETCQEKTATHRCVDCSQFCCDVCVTVHERIPSLRSHEVLTIDKYRYREIQSRGHLKVQSKVFCSVHKDSHLEFYCDTCQVPVCYKCTIVKHRVPEHVHRDLQEVADEYKTQLKEMLGQLKMKEKQVEEEKATAESTREEIRNQCEAEKEKVKRRAKEVIESVKREEKMLIDALDESARIELKDAAMNIDEREFRHGNIVSTHHYLQTLVHHGNAVHLLSTKPETTKRIKEMVAMETIPHISHDITEFKARSDLATLVGVIKSDVCPSKCTVENIPKQLMKGESVKLLITTRDSRGKQIIPHQNIQVKTKTHDASWETIDVTDTNNGTYHVTITGKIEGKKLVAMTIGNQHIPGSPFHIPVIRGLVQTMGKAGSEGELSNPWGITINKHGDFVTADFRNNRVVIHDRDGNYKQSFTFTGQFAETFTPLDVVISDDNEYFMTDINNNQIVVSDEYGKLIRKFRSSEIDNPRGIAINPVTKNVYVSEWSKHCIRKYTQGGVYIKSFGKSGDKQGEFHKPYLLAINSKGMVYVPDCFNHRIQVFNSDDQFMFEFSSTGDSRMSRSKGVAVDKNDYVYVSSDDKVTKHDSYGQFICKIDSDKDGLSYPFGVAVCNDGRIAVVDRGNNCIKVFVE